MFDIVGKFMLAIKIALCVLGCTTVVVANFYERFQFKFYLIRESLKKYLLLKMWCLTVVYFVCKM
jgi:hypothetical protein